MNYFTELETLAWEQNEGDGVLFLSSFFKLLPLVLEAGAGEEEADCDAGAFVCGFLISLSSSLPLFSKKERNALVPVARSCRRRWQCRRAIPPTLPLPSLLCFVFSFTPPSVQLSLFSVLPPWFFRVFLCFFEKKQGNESLLWFLSVPLPSFSSVSLRLLFFSSALSFFVLRPSWLFFFSPSQPLGSVFLQGLFGYALSFLGSFLPPPAWTISGFYSQRTMPFLQAINCVNCRCNGGSGGVRPFQSGRRWTLTGKRRRFWCLMAICILDLAFLTILYLSP